MTTVPEFTYDPSDMAALRAKLARLPEALSFPHFELDRVEIGPQAIWSLPAILGDLTPAAGPLILVQDATPMRRDGDDLKALVRRAAGRRRLAGQDGRPRGRRGRPGPRRRAHGRAGVR
jgi:hypothetical protein